MFKESKYKVVENYFKTDISWNSALDMLYKSGKDSQPSIMSLYFKIKNEKIFSDLPELKEFFKKVNEDFDSDFVETCVVNNNLRGGVCDCGGLWHLDAIILSLAPLSMSAHKDLTDVCYLQAIGKSFWKLDEDITVVLNPGDLLFLSKQTKHEVWGEGPRLGILSASRW